jgi:hypothetical protein
MQARLTMNPCEMRDGGGAGRGGVHAWQGCDRGRNEAGAGARSVWRERGKGEGGRTRECGSASQPASAGDGRVLNGSLRRSGGCGRDGISNSPRILPSTVHPGFGGPSPLPCSIHSNLSFFASLTLGTHSLHSYQSGCAVARSLSRNTYNHQLKRVLFAGHLFVEKCFLIIGR